MFILRLFITGLVAFVPLPDGRTLDVLLPNATHLVHDDPHYAMVVFDQRDVDQASGRDDWGKIAPLINGSGNSSARGWLLDGEQLRLGQGQVVTLPLSLAHTLPSGSPRPVRPTSNGEEWDFSWVPPLKMVSPVDDRVDAGLLARPTRDRVAGLLSLDQGYVRTYSLARALDEGGQDRGEVLAFRFASPDSKVLACSQAMAEMVVVEIPVMAPSLRLASEVFGGGAESWVTLRPRPGQATVDVLLANLSPSKPRTSSMAVHFQHYYDLLASQPEVAKRVVPSPCEAPATMAAGQQRTSPRPVALPSIYLWTVHATDKGPLARPICTATVLSPAASKAQVSAKGGSQ
jgi:hypothetical protein